MRRTCITSTAPTTTATATQVSSGKSMTIMSDVERNQRIRHHPYSPAPANAMDESIFSKLKLESQQAADSDSSQLDAEVMDAFDTLVASYQGNERSLRSLDVLLGAMPSNLVVQQQMRWLEEGAVSREYLDVPRGYRMHTQQEIERDADTLVALTFGQLPLTGLTDPALFYFINDRLPGAAVFVTAAAHPKMRSHGLRFVLVRQECVELVKDLMHHRLLFTSTDILVLSPWAATREGFRVLACILSVRDKYLKDAVQAACRAYGDQQSKLTGGSWPATVQECRKSLYELARFATNESQPMMTA